MCLIVLGVLTVTAGCAGTPAATPTTTPAAESSVVKPGEEWIVFQGAKSCIPHAQEESGICLERPDGTGRHVLPLGASGEGLHPDWSPDGSQIAYSIDGTSIWTSGVDGKNAKKVADPGVISGGNGTDFPAWSPDGSKIAYSAYVGNGVNGPDRTAIEILDLASGTSTTIFETASTFRADQPRWSHDGTRLVIQIEHVDASGDDVGASIDLIPAAGGSPTVVVPESFFGSYPDWNPNDDQIVFTRNEFNPAGGPVGLYLVKTDGTGLAPLVFANSSALTWRQPSWSPDGKKIIFVEWDTHGTAVMNADGSGLVVNQQLSTTHPRLRPLP